MFKSILVPLDGSALSARALPLAKRMALAAGARLIVVRAHLPTDDLGLRLEYPGLSAAERRSGRGAHGRSVAHEARASQLAPISYALASSSMARRSPACARRWRNA